MVPRVMLESMSIPFLGTALLSVAATLATTAQSPDPIAILRQNQEAMFALKSYQAICTTKLTFDKGSKKQGRVEYQWARLLAEKPTKMRYDSWEAKKPISANLKHFPVGTPDQTKACDGNQYFQQYGDQCIIAQKLETIDLRTMLEPWDGFYSRFSSIYSTAQSDPGPGYRVETTYSGMATVDGVLCDKVLVHLAGSQEYYTTYFIGRDDHLVREETYHVTFDGKPGFVSEAHIQHFVLNGAISSSLYKYNLE
jgi:hypothetical protein